MAGRAVLAIFHLPSSILAFLRHAGEDFDLSVPLPQAGNTAGRELANTNNHGLRAKLLLDLRQGGGGAGGDEGNEGHRGNGRTTNVEQ